MLKDWLVRRRENPYPSRDEKRRLAYDTGLTYTQISNWFANWRRKLKNNDGRTYKNSWGHLISSFTNMDRERDNTIEKQSFSSNDSIWDDEAPRPQQSSPMEISKTNNPGFYVEHETDKEVKPQTVMTTSNPKYKQKIMEKYLRDTSDQNVNSNPELSKWLESAEKFTPEKCNYYIEWDLKNRKRINSMKSEHEHAYESIHEREELDAAEALANLAFNSRQRMVNVQF